MSIANIFKIGVGPSSSHTTGPMTAAKKFVDQLDGFKLIDKVDRVEIVLYGSLALTGKGHGTIGALICGLNGFSADKVETDFFIQALAQFDQQTTLNLANKKIIAFDKNCVEFRNEFLDYHSNGIDFCAYDKNHRLIYQLKAYSVGGGDVHFEQQGKIEIASCFDQLPFQYPYKNAADLIKIATKENITLAQISAANELSYWDQHQLDNYIEKIFVMMNDCIVAGLNTKGILPGGLNVRRRASDIYDKLRAENYHSLASDLDWLSVYAIAVNEQNAAYGKVVTSPTNGAAGVIPAVLRYYLLKVKAYDISQIRQNTPAFTKIKEFLLTASLIGSLYKMNASVSAAEMGCQGEIGVASSMAAGAFCAVLAGSVYQVENAAEIAMEHSLGMTCDPIKGLVQIPCIERNTMGAIKAVNAAKLALNGDGKHIVSLDQVIKTMYQTGRDMNQSYKETSLKGLAVNVVEC